MRESNESLLLRRHEEAVGTGSDDILRKGQSKGAFVKDFLGMVGSLRQPLVLIAEAHCGGTVGFMRLTADDITCAGPLKQDIGCISGRSANEKCDCARFFAEF